MRPVNLLPSRYRPRTGGGADSKSSYIALGALALLVLAIFGYVMAANGVSSKNAEIADTRQRIQAAEAQAVTLKGFGDFAGVKEARLTAVKSLATERLDWERIFRELAHVLPERVWLTKFNGTAAGGESEDPSAIQLTGCAASHAQIADVMVRLRELHVAQEVELTKTSASEEEQAAVPTGTVSPTGTGAASGDDSGCGKYYSFELSVTVASAPPVGDPTGQATVPARLGGGE